jgi:hypothetical protein
MVSGVKTIGNKVGLSLNVVPPFESFVALILGPLFHMSPWFIG